MTQHPIVEGRACSCTQIPSQEAPHIKDQGYVRWMFRLAAQKHDAVHPRPGMTMKHASWTAFLMLLMLT